MRNNGRGGNEGGYLSAANKLKVMRLSPKLSLDFTFQNKGDYRMIIYAITDRVLSYINHGFAPIPIEFQKKRLSMKLARASHF